MSDPVAPAAPAADESVLVQARREKLRRWREEFGVEPYGHRVDGIVPLAEARGRFDQAAHDARAEAEAAHKADPDGAPLPDDPRPVALVAGRVIQHRDMGKLVFMVLRDHTGDLQISLSRDDLPNTDFRIGKKLDYGDIVVAEGPVGMTRKGEICIWANRLEVHAKSLAPPPEKFHGLADAELRYRQRYVDMYDNPETMRVMQQRSRLVSRMRRFMDKRDFLEVETPMMQPVAGGAAARPFVTHHNTLDMQLFLRIAPELYLKRLLVGGMPRVYEINRNFRNEGVSRRHNPEFTMMEVYEAFGDCESMLELTESLIHELAADVAGDADDPQLPFGDDLAVSYRRPFERVAYGDLVERHAGVSMFDEAAVRTKAKAAHIENADTLDHWLLVNELFERYGEPGIDPARPTFVTDFPAAISPLTRPHRDNPALSHRWELFIAGMELANSYTELNDPDVQLEKFTAQLTGEDDEQSTFRTLDHDFINALRVGMPPAGGLGVGIDRVIMLLTNSTSIRDVILFPLLRGESGGDTPPADETE